MTIKISDFEIRESYPDLIPDLDGDNSVLEQYLNSLGVSSAEVDVSKNSSCGFNYAIRYGDRRDLQFLSSEDLASLSRHSD